MIGIDRETFPTASCMVSPWMTNGTVLMYLHDRGHGDLYRLVSIARKSIILCWNYMDIPTHIHMHQLCEIAEGLEYLHAQKIVHGDLRGTNILISDDNSACLSDFGLATIVGDAESTTVAITSSSANRGGSVRWFAPELIWPPSFGYAKFAHTTASDVYAYACVCVEVRSSSNANADFRCCEPPTRN